MNLNQNKITFTLILGTFVLVIAVFALFPGLATTILNAISHYSISPLNLAFILK